jgi:hypothetical protein
MSVLASCHLPDGTWAFDVQPESPSPNIEIGFTSDVTPVTFDALSFGFAVSVAGTQIVENAYPPEGVRYVATDQRYMSNDRVDLAADDEATLTVWMENAGERSEASTTFVVLRPEQPYPSWVWDDGSWAAPVPYPSDGGSYVWDEEAGDWVAVELSGEE